MTDRPLPQSIEAERGILGIVLEQNEALFEMTSIVSKTDFMDGANGEIFTLARDMIESGREAKPLTLMHDMARDRDIGGMSASAYLDMLLHDAPHVSTAITLARTVRDLAMRRRLISVAEEHIREAYEAPATIGAAEIEGRYHAAASVLFSTANEIGLRTLDQLGKQVVQETQDAFQHETRRGYGSGLKALDDLWGPLLPGRLHCLSGASGSGKTALAWQIARHVAQEGAVLFNSIEMDGVELATRDLTGISGVAGPVIERGDVNVEQMQSLILAHEQQRHLKLFVDSAKRPTVGSIRGKAMRLQRLHGLKLVVIDHLRYVRPSNPRLELFEAQSDILQSLNAMADDLGVTVILLCQFKAQYGSEPKIREPNIGDIFNGAVIEQESDALLIVHREEYMLARRKPADAKEMADWEDRKVRSKGKANLLLQKRRGGLGYGAREIGFVAEAQRFTDELPRHEFSDFALG